MSLRDSWNLQFQSKQAQNVTRNKAYKVLIFFQNMTLFYGKGFTKIATFKCNKSVKYKMQYCNVADIAKTLTFHTISTSGWLFAELLALLEL
jgi:hypothetical protein